MLKPHTSFLRQLCEKKLEARFLDSNKFSFFKYNSFDYALKNSHTLDCPETDTSHGTFPVTPTNTTTYLNCPEWFYGNVSMDCNAQAEYTNLIEVCDEIRNPLSKERIKI